MAKSVSVSDTVATVGMSCTKEALKAFLKRYRAEDYWKAIGVTPPAVNGFRKGSSLAGQKAIATLADQLYRQPIVPDALHTYEKLWTGIVDKVTDKAWSSPTALACDDPTSAKTLLARVLDGSKSVSREEIELLLQVAPFDIGDGKELVSQIPLRDTIAAQRSIGDMRVALGRLEARLAEALDQAASSADVEQVRADIGESVKAATAQARAASALLEERGAQVGELQSAVERASVATAEFRDQIVLAVSELTILKQQNVDLSSRVQAVEESLPKAQATKLAATSTKAATSTFPIKPLVRIVEHRANDSSTIAAVDNIKQIVVALRSAGLTKQSAETTASVLSASFIACGWVNISGSLSAHLAERLTSAASARHCLVSIPVGCLEQIPRAPSERTGAPTLWRVLGFDRAPVQVTSRYLKSYTVNKLISGRGDNFVIAVHEGGEICRNVLPDAAQLGAWIDTDALVWSQRAKRDTVKPFSLAAFALNETEANLEEGDHRVKPALARLLEARFMDALGLFVTNEALKSSLLERHVIAPVCATDASVDLDSVINDDQAMQIAIRLRAL